ncbi:hypothetical protein [Gaoshiqia sediminis]|uniref:Na+-driven multidrug efflux pump n=1 Tax=Gaoshiqia sediminis TaxID=2986998 RepID=A0AA41Y8L5_9BACT|nr:hypothetical protein [Gaoshiqia sediminis]MCW0483187.1 hypothetical protein [Gaoshiqia sediminis]
MQPAKRVVVNTGILYARMAITIFISLYVTRLILAALGAADFGIFNVVGGAIAMLTFLNTAMAAATQRFMSYAQGEGDAQKQKSIFNVSVLLHFLIAILVVLLLEGVGYFLFNGILKIPEDRVETAMLIYQFMLVSTFFTIISVPYDAVINAHEHMLLVAILGIIEALLKLAIAIYVTNTSLDKLASYGFLMAALSVFLLLLRRIYCHRKYHEVQIRIRRYFDKLLFKEMTGYASWALLSSAASIISMQGITIILNSFFGVVVNAAQGVANQISGQLLAFSSTMLKALNPVIVKSEGENNRDQMLKASMTGSKISFFLLSFLSIPVIFEMPFILDIWLKEVPEYAVIFCRLILIRLSIGQLTVTFPTSIGAIGNIKMFSTWDSIIYISVLPLSFIAFKLGTPPPTIYIILIVMVLALSVSRIYYINILGGLSFLIYLKNVLYPSMVVSTVTVSTASIPYIFMEEGYYRLSSVLLLSSISFIIAFYLWGLNAGERDQIKKMQKSIICKLNGHLKVGLS